MFTPALRLLKNYMPESQVDALVMYKGAEEILAENPNLNKIYFFDFLNSGLFKSFKFVLGLRRNYGASINVYPSNRREYNIINYLIGAKQRVAARYLRKDGRNFGFLNNVSVLENDITHNVKTNIRLCEALLGIKFEEEPPLEFNLASGDLVTAEGFFSEKSIGKEDIVIGFHPGCASIKNHSKRRWEPEKFARLAKKLIAEHKSKILIFGGPEENELKVDVNKKIDSDNSFIVNAGSLSKSSAIMNRCNVFITNDSSQMHIASALHLKVVAIIGPTNSNYIHPWKTEHRLASLDLDCSPCFFYSPRPLICNRDDVKFKCIKELSVDMVYDAVKSFL